MSVYLKKFKKCVSNIMKNYIFNDQKVYIEKIAMSSP